ncbi:hypothetical protein Ancab_002015 [Ancistrocladus abbreviatus]
MLPDGSDNLSDSCLPEYPWSKFPFSGFFAMLAALLTLVADFVGTQIYERRQERMDKPCDNMGQVGLVDSVAEGGVGIVPCGAGGGGGRREGVWGGGRRWDAYCGHTCTRGAPRA